MSFVSAREALLDVAARHDAARVRERLFTLNERLMLDLDEVEQILAGLCAPAPDVASRSAQHLLSVRGKLVRPTLCLLAARACGGPRDVQALRMLAAVTEAVHASTLLHDDVIDLGDTRRDRPTARVIFGNAASVLGGDLLLVRALELIEAAGVPTLLPSLLSVLRRMILAESLQLARRGRTDLRAQDYFDVVEGKTASLFEFAVEAGAKAAGAGLEIVTPFVAFGGSLGVAFQVLDDLLDLKRDPAEVGKAVLQDVRAGTVTWPVLLALEVEPSLSPRLQAAVRGEDDPSLATDLLTLVGRVGAIERAQTLVEQKTEAALDALDAVPDGEARTALGTLARALMERAR